MHQFYRGGPVLYSPLDGALEQLRGSSPMRQIVGRVRFLDLLPITCEDVHNEVRKGLKLVGHYLLAEISYQRKS